VTNFNSGKKNNQMKKQIQFWQGSIARFLTVAVAMVCLLGFSVSAQHNFSLIFRPGANFPVSDFETTKLNGGCGFEFMGAWQFSNRLAAYGGWGYNFYGDKEAAENLQKRFDENGYTFGLQYLMPFYGEKVNLLFGAGAVYDHVETFDNDGNILHDTGHELGWQLEAGLSFPLGEKWKMIPTVRYRALTFDGMNESSNTSAHLNSLSVGVGVGWTVWKQKQ
jgi:hypothetical protein